MEVDGMPAARLTNAGLVAVAAAGLAAGEIASLTGTPEIADSVRAGITLPVLVLALLFDGLRRPRGP
jgi:hypothetical protein